MNDITDKITAFADLEGCSCQLEHHDKEYRQAINFLCVPIGISEHNSIQIQIAICVECQDGLTDPEWHLCYCYGCGESQWISKQYARRVYCEEITWMNECPKCLK